MSVNRCSTRSPPTETAQKNALSTSAAPPVSSHVPAAKRPRRNINAAMTMNAATHISSSDRTCVRYRTKSPSPAPPSPSTRFAVPRDRSVRPSPSTAVMRAGNRRRSRLVCQPGRAHDCAPVCTFIRELVHPGVRELHAERTELGRQEHIREIDLQCPDRRTEDVQQEHQSYRLSAAAFRHAPPSMPRMPGPRSSAGTRTGRRPPRTASWGGGGSPRARRVLPAGRTRCPAPSSTWNAAGSRAGASRGSTRRAARG